MFHDLRIQRFRLFEDLRIDRLSRVNLIAGKNNTGKTTVLEALFLLSGGGAPQLLDRTLGFRGIGQALGQIDRVPETHWEPLFFGFEAGEPIAIRAETARHGPLNLTLRIERRDSVEVRSSPSGIAGATVVEGEPAGLDLGPSDPRSLRLVWQQREEQPAEGRIELFAKGLRLQNPLGAPFPAFFVSSRTHDLATDAMRLGQLRTKKMGGRLTEALQAIEPRLRSVEDSVAGGSPMIWGDIGLPRLLPLAAMGEGMAAVTSLVLAMAAAEKGVVLVDEIERGIHHSVMEDLWRVVDRSSREFDTQVIATTHSYECLMAAQRAFSQDGESEAGDFRFQRLERARDGGMRSVGLDPDDLAAVARHGLEVR